ncbi:MAG: hypothetical protein PHX87_06475 [Candidatus Peribacteraceae bacterium]|nr:hypothetical protein [Candidatus Peribacteraceae bacterium]MDD5743034.1 hypothetical protein [Candidatus Peribacteraceae bacterium]
MPSSPEPSTAECKILMAAAVLEVRTAQAQVAIRSESNLEKIDPSGESLRPLNTIRNTPAFSPEQQILRRRFAEEYKSILRAAARALEPDHETRHAIYRLLSCAPEEQP